MNRNIDKNNTTQAIINHFNVNRGKISVYRLFAPHKYSFSPWYHHQLLHLHKTNITRNFAQ